MYPISNVKFNIKFPKKIPVVQICNVIHIDHACVSYWKLMYIYNNYLKNICGSLHEYVKGANGVCFALKSSKEILLLFTYLITLCKDVTFPFITKFKTNRSPSYLSVNRIPN